MNKARIIIFVFSIIIRTLLSYDLDRKWSIDDGINNNQEDSIIVSKGAIDRGMFRSACFKTFKDEEVKKSSSSSEEFMRPDPSNCLGVKRKGLHNLDHDVGLVEVGSSVNGGDVIIGKVSSLPACTDDIQKAKMQYKDASMTIRHNDSGVVDRVLLSTSEKGSKIAKVTIRKLYIPIIGDKLCSRSAQKGTIGMILNDEDMPFTKDGIKPDIIINTHCIPSRMTIGQLFEGIFGKHTCLSGKMHDSTSFEDHNVDKIADELHELGFNRYGKEVLYHGMTGKKIDTMIYIGPTYYQRLKHLVSEKLHARGSQGPIVNITRQPMEGKAKDGGLRSTQGLSGKIKVKVFFC